MAELEEMPEVRIAPETLLHWGALWRGTEPAPKQPDRFTKAQGMEFGRVFDEAFGQALASMLGGIPVVTPSAKALTPAEADCVEVGTTRVIGGIRPQNYDVAYRPDGPRVVFDSKTLNDRSSIRKNWQNMINDLASESATVHTRFPFCLVVFIVVLPAPALPDAQRRSIVSTLGRLGSRKSELDQHHLAEAIALVVWDPDTGQIQTPSDSAAAGANPPIQLSALHHRVHRCYLERYQHLPPHIS